MIDDSPESRKGLVFLMYALACFTALNYFTNGFLGHLASSSFDYSVTYTAGRKILAGNGDAVYAECMAWQPGQPITYAYPAPVAIVLSPLSAFPPAVAKLLLKLVTQVFLFLSFYFLLKTISPAGKLEKLAAFFILFNFYPVYYSLFLGQFELLMLAPLLLSFYYFRKGNDWASAFLLAVPVCFKVFPVVFLLYFLWKREYSYCLKLFCALAVVFLLSLPVVGFDAQRDWFIRMAQGYRDLDAFPDHQGIAGFFSRIFTQTIYTSGWVDSDLLKKVFVYASSAAVLLLTGKATAGRLERGDMRYLLEFGFVITGMLLVSNVTNTHHLALLVVPFTYLIIMQMREGAVLSARAIGLLCCYGFFATYVPLVLRNMDPGAFPFLRAGLPLLLLSIPFYFLVFFWVLNLKQLLKANNNGGNNNG